MESVYKQKLDHTSRVLEFTEGSMGKKMPKIPNKMTIEEVRFLTKMVLSELVELAQTVTPDTEQALELIEECVGTDVKLDYVPPETTEEIIAEQADSLVDIWYYSLNAAVKKGWNLDRIFDIVHQANMNKCWDDGEFHRREDGKIIKPTGWQEPNVLAEIQKQQQYGSDYTLE